MKKEIKILIAGGRDFEDYAKLESFMYEKVFPQIGYDENTKITIIEGEARGADTLARKFAEENNFEVLKFPANWEEYGRAAGFIRNKQMLDEGKPDYLVAFWNGESKGTRNMIELVRKRDYYNNHLKNPKQKEPGTKSSIFICKY